MITREPPYLEPPVNAIAALGRRVIASCQGSGRALMMLLGAVKYLPFMFSRRNRADVMQQCYLVGIKSLGVVSVVGLFTGMILALQLGLALRTFGQEWTIGTLVCNAMLREMGPFMTGLVVAASVGSAIAAQIGTMTVSEEIAALDVMGIDPLRYLMMPRLVALAAMTPLLALYMDMIGLFGGSVVGATMLGVSYESYFDGAFRYTHNKDLYVGLLKAFIFGVIVVCVSCYQGFITGEGAVGVGRATRRTVVVSFLLILTLGYFVTRLAYR
ncbi:MAG TPA: ABC transporter permease [Kiritimatiellia bacterium]|jgi:phospholipid/cholesterol/gamma-HCH transport system permease protein|nr:ABC transporter permease [Kiritimatiellia bacterium]OQC55488.1 MAG: putative phospholipid ABC transporter permease protein MlaE [Verrucomicrobia bacterium ADurb.Bin018]MBP9572343.1 ABC transporter permease [Kiritimatiellia bacterium]HOE01450.1 ABC transporter permease [Kiritimatiellia bacterium]HOE37809.1 ABC transporter permease [Kiritimatiellia bacterium]